MRKIKFRAWDLAHKLMYTMEELLDENHVNPDVLRDCLEQPGDGYDEDTVLMQFTGLHDKDGVEIYEGDVVKTDNKHLQVIYQFASFSLGNGEFLEEFGYGLKDHAPSAIKVIGNIYEHPELIK